MKNSALFIEYLLSNNIDDWYFAISEPVKDLLTKLGVEIDERFSVYLKSPAHSYSARKRLQKAVERRDVSGVYTMAGPSYCRFKKYHVMGISNPYLTHYEHRDFLRYANKHKIVQTYARIFYQNFHAKNADHFIFQTKQSALGFCSRRKISEERCSVIPNAVDFRRFQKKSTLNKTKNTSKNCIIAVPGHPFEHKCLHQLVDYALALKSLGVPGVVFRTTLSDDVFEKIVHSRARRERVDRMFENAGELKYSAMPNFYRDADLVFVPSALETYSATYVEAFASGIPLIVSDRKFAHEICGRGAHYVDPFNNYEVASTLYRLIDNPVARLEAIQFGEQNLANLINQDQRNALLNETVCALINK